MEQPADSIGLLTPGVVDADFQPIDTPVPIILDDDPDSFSRIVCVPIRIDENFEGRILAGSLLSLSHHTR